MKPLTLNEYQIAAAQTAIYPHPIVYPALGLTGEAGEVADKIKKVIRDRSGDFSSEDVRRDIAKEIGDVLWYCAMLSHDLGFSLEEVARLNIDKLQSRQRRDAIHGNGDNR